MVKDQIVNALKVCGKLEPKQIAFRCNHPLDNGFRGLIQQLINEGKIRQGKPTRFHRRGIDVWYEVV
jgi:hypothetical protein